MPSIMLLGFLSALPVAYSSSVTILTTRSTQTMCNTLVGASAPKSVPTSYAKDIVRTIDFMWGTSTVIPTTTVTVPRATSVATQNTTVTETVTADDITDSYTSTSTIYVTETDINWTTSTSTEVAMAQTSTVSTTSVVPTPAGFLFANETEFDSPAQVITPRTPSKRFVKERSAAAVGINVFAAKKATAVQCARTVWVAERVLSLKTAERKATVYATPVAVTKTVLATFTSTSTILPSSINSTSVISEYSYTTITSTYTETAVSTSTPVVTMTSTSTTYAACPTGNIVGPAINFANGTTQYLIGGGPVDSTWTWTYTSIPDAYDCCVYCNMNPECGGTVSVFYGGFNHCWTAVSNTGARDGQSDAAISYSWNNGGQANVQFDVQASNGPAGYAYLAGQTS